MQKNCCFVVGMRSFFGGAERPNVKPFHSCFDLGNEPTTAQYCHPLVSGAIVFAESGVAALFGSVCWSQIKDPVVSAYTVFMINLMIWPCPVPVRVAS